MPHWHCVLRIHAIVSVVCDSDNQKDHNNVTSVIVLSLNNMQILSILHRNIIIDTTRATEITDYVLVQLQV